MGEYADMVLEGHMCQGCGEYIDDGDAGGFARYCTACMRDPEAIAPLGSTRSKPAKTIKCKLPGCGRTFATERAREQHTAERHKRKT